MSLSCDTGPYFGAADRPDFKLFGFNGRAAAEVGPAVSACIRRLMRGANYLPSCALFLPSPACSVPEPQPHERPMPDDLQDQFRELPPRERGIVLRSAKAVHALIALEDRLRPAQALTFLAAWTDEGLTVSVLARRCDFKTSTVSRHLSELSARVTHRHRGLDLLTADDRQIRGDFRLRRVFLTERGHRLATRMVEVMKNHHMKQIIPMGPRD